MFSNKKIQKTILVCSLIAMQINPLVSFGAITDISNSPLNSSNNVQPNISFTLDDSGSMDWEVLLGTNSGAAFSTYTTNNSVAPGFIGCGYTISNATTGSLADDCSTTNKNNGVLNFSAGSISMYEFGYLFPNGFKSDAKLYGVSSILGIAPISKNSYFRSSDYNPMYYNSTITYQPWANTTNYTFSNATPTAVKSHPIYTGSVNLDLTSNIDGSIYNDPEWGFSFLPGTTIPFVSVPGTKYWNGSSWATFGSDYLVTSGQNFLVSMPYYASTFYNKDTTCTTSNITSGACTYAPNGTTMLRKYEIKATTSTYPSGRTYVAEMQNFANWFQYYRKRKLMLAGAMGQVLPNVNNIYGGVSTLSNTYQNPPSPLVLDNFATTGYSNTLEVIYKNTATTDTPTKAAMKFVGDQFMNNTSIIKYACQSNANIVLTDGYANASGPATTTYDQTKYGTGVPYQSIYSGSLADQALYYYSTNLRPDLSPLGVVPHDLSTGQINPDLNNNLHLNTYAVTLGSLGLFYGNSTYGITNATTNAFTTPPAWVNPNTDYSPTAVDDLWHATINGRGAMYTASNPSDVKTFLNSIISNILTKSASRSSVGVSSINVTGTNNNVYDGSYNASNWFGDLVNYTVSTTTGKVSSTALWSSQTVLDAKPIANRNIATYSGSAGIVFDSTLAATATTMYNQLNTNSTSLDAAFVLSYLRGDRTKETPSGPYRSRTHLLGDINADPVYVQGGMASYVDPGYSTYYSSLANRTAVVFQGANDGMLHAFSASNGDENWAYVPKLVFPNLQKLSATPYSHQYYVDGTPVFNDVDFGNTGGTVTTPDWRTMMVGGLKAGGKGFYALDITSTTASSAANAASKVLWEFPNASTPTATANNVGYSFGKPLIVKTADKGWVVLLSSGYNNTTGDGQGHLFVLNAKTGALIQDISTGSGSVTSPSGLSGISAWQNTPQYDAKTDAAYGGDLDGNLWKFDLTAYPYKVFKLAQVTDNSGVGQPITTAPELSKNSQGQRTLYFGTGQLLGNSDLGSTQTQSIYAIVDRLDNTTITNLRTTSLLKKTVTVDAGTLNRHISQEAMDWSTYRGWYFDLPASSERVAGDIQILNGVLVFASNIPSISACSSSAFLYSISAENGGELPIQVFVEAGLSSTGGTYSGQSVGSNLTTKPVLIELPNGVIDALIHSADNSISSYQVPTSTKQSAKIISWREVIIQ